MAKLAQGKVTYNHVVDYKGIDLLRLAYCQYCIGEIVVKAEAADYSPASPKVFI